MFNLFRIPGLLSGLLLALVASTNTVWAQTTNQHPATPPVTVTLQVPTTATGASTTIQLQVRTDVNRQQTTLQVASDANPSAPTIIAARVGGDSVATVPVDASDAFVWAVSPNPTSPGCGPHPAAATPGCSRAGTTPPTPPTPPAPQPGTLLEGPAAPAATTSDPSTATASTATLAAASAQVLQYTVQPGDTLTAVARRFYGDTAATDRIVETNLGQPMPDGRSFADANQILPGWVLTLPQPAQSAYERDGQCWYIVQPGDALSTIAARLLGSASRWPQLYALNRDRIEDPSRIRVGQVLQLPLSQPATTSAQPGHDAEPIQADRPQPEATESQPEPAEASTNAAPGADSRSMPAWASPLKSNPAATTAPGITPPAGPAATIAGPSASPLATQDLESVGASTPSRVELRPDLGSPPPVGAESQGIRLWRSGARGPLAAAAAADAVVLSTALGVWLFRRRSHARLQPRLSLVPIGSTFQPAAPALSGGPPRNDASPASDTDRRACRRARVLQAVLDSTLTHADAAAQLEVSTRQLRRLLAAYRGGGVDALRHANAGRHPAHAVSDGVRDQIMELVRTRYAGLSQSELAHRLATEHGIQLHRTTVRRILMAAEQAAAPAAERTTGSQADCDPEPVRGLAQRSLHIPGVGGGAVIRGLW
jgi:nucleoid-associated protein YgaU/transposase